jgi:glycosyltransferase involved in cell wall biosynthesis
VRVRGEGRGAPLALIQTTVPAYRDAFIRHLLEQSSRTLICAGDDYFDPTIRLSPFAATASRRLKNRFLFGRRLEWQRGAFSAVRSARVVVLELNPRILSNWPILLYRRVFGRRTILWGHAWPRRGERASTFLLRVPLLWMANAVLVYTYEDRDRLAARVRRPVFVAPNAVASRGDWSSARGGTHMNAVQVGRLVPAKKPALAIEAWLRVCHKLDSSSSLVVVGDGPMRPQLELLVAGHRYGHRVQFMGEVTDRITLNAVYADALISICAGYAGLSVTDSLGFGVPVLIADNEPHSPEIALTSSANSRFFRAGDASSLAEGILQFFADRELWVSRRSEVAEDTRRMYSIEAMVRGFLDAVHGG